MTMQSRCFGAVAFAFVALVLSACENESAEPSAAERALAEVQKKYDELVKEQVDGSVQWATEDIENIGDWEYKVESLTFSSPEELAAELNEFGNEKWELVWLDRTPGGFLVVLKKPAVSYLNKIPLSKLGFYVIGATGGEE